MELFKSLTGKTKLYESPFKHYELNEPLTTEAIKEVCEADIPDPVSYTHLTLPTNREV